MVNLLRSHVPAFTMKLCSSKKPQSFAEAQQQFRKRKKAVTIIGNVGLLFIVAVILTVVYTKPSGSYSSDVLAMIIVLPMLLFVIIIGIIDRYINHVTKKHITKIQHSQGHGAQTAPNIPTFGWNFSTPVVTSQQIPMHNNPGTHQNNTQNFAVPSFPPNSQYPQNSSQVPYPTPYPPQNPSQAPYPTPYPQTDVPYPTQNSPGVFYPTPFQNNSALPYATGISPYPPAGPSYPIGSFPQRTEVPPYPVEAEDPPPAYSTVK